MKRTLWLVLALMMLVYGALAEGTPEALEDLYEVHGEGTVLAVRLPANPTPGYRWDFEISNTDLLELINCEEPEDEALSTEDKSVSSGAWIGSFKCASLTEGDAGSATLTLLSNRYPDPDPAGPSMGYVIDVWVQENGQLEVTGIRPLELVATAE